MDVMDCFNAIYPDKQLMIEIDHSSGHAKYRDDGLHVVHMNVKFGGKQRVLRNTIITEGCVGAGQAKTYSNGRDDNEEWTTDFVEGVTRKTVDVKVAVGDTQRMSFGAIDPPPFYDCSAPRYDTKETKHEHRRRQELSPQASPAGRSDGSEYIIREGYVGKAKGMRQVLWERGLYVSGMSTSANTDEKLRMDLVLASTADFKNEKPALMHLVESRGHIILLSPKCHPEVAGLGIEYSWGMSKMKFRREINDEGCKHLHDNIEASFCRENILTLGRIRRFARRARDFCRAYRALNSQGPIGSKNTIEKMCKVQKAHRSIIDMEPGFINTQ